MRFRDRTEAGELLAEKLKGLKDSGALVYTLPRGGVVVGYEVARALGTPLYAIIVRKVGHPHNPEYAVCAVSEHGKPVCNEEEARKIDAKLLDELIYKERKEAERRREVYLKDIEQPDSRGKVVILVDDGVATGLTLRAAIRELAEKHPAKIIVAVPVAPRAAVDYIAGEADEFVAVETPRIYMGSVGAYYDDFPQVSDEEVVRLLDESHR